MSTDEVAAAAQAVIDETAALMEKKTKAIADLWEQHGIIESFLEAFGEIVTPKPRKALSDEARKNISEAQKRRHAKKGGTEQDIYAQPE